MVVDKTEKEEDQIPFTQDEKSESEKQPAPLDIVFIEKEIPKHIKPKSTRLTKPSEALRSPYKERVVQLHEKKHTIEARIADWIFSANGDIWEPLFKTASGRTTRRIALETFYPNEYLHAGVITSWSAVLNSEELYRSSDSRARLFGLCNMMGGYNLSKKREEFMLENFRLNMQSILCDSPFSSIKAVEMLFLPILQDKHFYLLIFDFKTPAIEIVDNMKYKGKLKAKHATRVRMMTKVLLSYLKKESPKMYANIKDLEPTRLELPWGTTNNFADCGVFAMRHMETYHGKNRRWDCGLSTESKTQSDELADLRLKYLRKILLADINMLRDQVKSKVEEFEKLDKAEMDEMRVNAHKRIRERTKEALG
ncbi:putative Ulp1 protease family catalytic domain, papain-like cysteine peptidase superfamily [Helianthus anomalus]